ncbi:uncharacterized protein LOC125237504 isoform X2 [Leguminivora glycinivorella]|uniref:uncharacterized protein LOC125237504 isoform X2 n=1 Tax=Leguminivora glycinivorella TaxID=1035111 RepID=UPI00200C7F3A|nr:uncharacterized protein LOC125237504 isoform X2 [Leguminivora glycinivorella]
MPPRCVYLECKTEVLKCTKSIFRFPIKKPKLLEEWIKNCGNPKLAKYPVAALRNKYVCIDHFDEKFIKSTGVQRKRLTRDAVPRPYEWDASKLFTDLPAESTTEEYQTSSGGGRYRKVPVRAEDLCLFEDYMLAEETSEPTPEREPRLQVQVPSRFYTKQTKPHKTADACDVELVRSRCEECRRPVRGFEWWCLVCGLRCDACARRMAHRPHFLLRAPLHATREQTRAVVAAIAQQLRAEELWAPRDAVRHLGPGGEDLCLDAGAGEEPLVKAEPGSPRADPLLRDSDEHDSDRADPHHPAAARDRRAGHSARSDWGHADATLDLPDLHLRADSDDHDSDRADPHHTARDCHAGDRARSDWGHADASLDLPDLHLRADSDDYDSDREDPHHTGAARDCRALPRAGHSVRSDWGHADASLDLPDLHLRADSDDYDSDREDPHHTAARGSPAPAPRTTHAPPEPHAGDSYHSDWGHADTSLEVPDLHLRADSDDHDSDPGDLEYLKRDSVVENPTNSDLDPLRETVDFRPNKELEKLENRSPNQDKNTHRQYKRKPKPWRENRTSFELNPQPPAPAPAELAREPIDYHPSSDCAPLALPALATSPGSGSAAPAPVRARPRSRSPDPAPAPRSSERALDRHAEWTPSGRLRALWRRDGKGAASEADKDSAAAAAPGRRARVRTRGGVSRHAAALTRHAQHEQEPADSDKHDIDPHKTKTLRIQLKVKNSAVPPNKIKVISRKFLEENNIKLIVKQKPTGENDNPKTERIDATNRDESHS